MVKPFASYNPRLSIDLLFHLSVVVVGHSHCGAVIASWRTVRDGNVPDAAHPSPVIRWLIPLMQIADRLRPPVPGLTPEGSPAEASLVDSIARENIRKQVNKSHPTSTHLKLTIDRLRI